MAGPWEKYGEKKGPWESYSAAPAAEAAAPEGDMSWSDVGKGALKNAPASAMQFGKDILEPIMHPLKTIKTLHYDLPMAAAEKAGLINQGGEYSGKLDAIGGHFKERYGGVENIKRTMATDPVGTAADASMLLTSAGGAAARVPGAIGKVGRAVAAAGRVVDPLSVPIEGAKLAGRGAAEVIGGLGTHTGAESLKTAARAGYEGGEAGRAFQQNLRGAAPMEETVEAARSALNAIRQERGAAYRAGMKEVGKDKAVLNFDKVDDALVEISGVKTYKGQNLSPKTQDIRLEIGEAIRDWKALDPAEFHTAEGLDALKQKIGDIRDATQPGTPERVVADRAYQAIRQTIIKQAPEYATVMKGYENASKQIKEIEKTLSLNPNASVDTALRKLQSTLRDNVNTSFGRRKELADFLVNAGAPHLMERLAGQALKPWTPRGLAKLLGGEILAGGAAALGTGTAMGAGAGAVGVLPFMSPRIMGEAAYYAGKAGRVPGRAIGDTAFQTGRVMNAMDPREMTRQDAKAALRDKPQERYTKAEIEAMREVARGSAPVDTIMRVKRLLERPSPAERGAQGASYGGPL